MTLSNWLSSLTIIVIYWGFAGALGHALYQFRQTNAANSNLLWISVSGMGFGLQTLALPFALWPHISTVVAAVLVGSIIALRPTTLPRLFWNYRFGMRYVSLTMVLAIVWSITQLPLPLALLISICALLAGLYTWQYSLEFD
ncbi:MAG: hypothetical protein DWQ07_04370 [Chloroflexi bacterium]|nr:MAG: hypothetical protein DWQ07_04370 [Chloroflexota bacterium]MBL1194668.1 hypothetical protein [Chloroflexota bacterium]NOH11959.1 hypothetical protein [Chloroflexota bacterium]